MKINEQTLFETLQATPEGRAKLLQLAKSLDNPSYDDFLESLYEKINEIIIKIECARDKYFSHDEDAITNVIAGRLEEAGYIATEQTKQNGAVDLTVSLNEHKWIAEAKIAYSNSKILEGLLQLLTRYVTRDENAGLLIYIKKANSQTVFEDWVKYLCSDSSLKSYILNKNPEVREDMECVLNNIETEKLNVKGMSVNTKHKLVSGSSIKIQHFSAHLYFNPTDVSGNNAKQQRKDNALNNLANIYFEQLESNTPFDSVKCLDYLERLFRDLDPDDFQSNPT
ncbi:hypothetical protein [Aeromonas media]|uniref:hypothetical protein n=1 Tax=Aeromonas media TaxID=651 RepID=UPI002B46A9A5|nr:hypothetical protein [Aeromonas media]